MERKSRSLRWVTAVGSTSRAAWTGSWTEPSVQTVQLGPSAARLRGIRAASAYDALGRSSHNPPVVGSSPTRPTACHLNKGSRNPSWQGSPLRQTGACRLPVLPGSRRGRHEVSRRGVRPWRRGVRRQQRAWSASPKVAVGHRAVAPISVAMPLSADSTLITQ